MSAPSQKKEKLVIGAFNIRSFGMAKLSKPDISKQICQILRRYDICFIQEVRESDAKMNKDLTSPLLLSLLSKVSTKTKPYSGVISPNLGSGKHKEKYIYIYRSDKLKLIQTYLFGNEQNLFERQPYSAKFSLINRPNIEIVLLGIHVKPDKASSEIDLLSSSFNQLSISLQPSKPKNKSRRKLKWYEKLFSCFCPTMIQDHDEESGTGGGFLVGPIILGDLNAGKNYLTKKDFSNLKLYMDKANFTWLIGDDADTTVNDTKYAYDRIIIPSNQSHLFKGAKPYKFDEAFKLDKEKSLQISDHYPVETELHL